MSMLYSSKKNVAASTMSSSKGIPQKKTFLGYLWSRLYSLFSKFYGVGRSILWVTSTGFIVVILPFVMTYMMHMEKQIAKISANNNII